MLPGAAGALVAGGVASRLCGLVVVAQTSEGRGRSAARHRPPGTGQGAASRVRWQKSGGHGGTGYLHPSARARRRGRPQGQAEARPAAHASSAAQVCARFGPRAAAHVKIIDSPRGALWRGGVSRPLSIAFVYRYSAQAPMDPREPSHSRPACLPPGPRHPCRPGWCQLRPSLARGVVRLVVLHIRPFRPSLSNAFARRLYCTNYAVFPAVYVSYILCLRPNRVVVSLWTDSCCHARDACQSGATGPALRRRRRGGGGYSQLEGGGGHGVAHRLKGSAGGWWVVVG